MPRHSWKMIFIKFLRNVALSADRLIPFTSSAQGKHYQKCLGVTLKSRRFGEAFSSFIAWWAARPRLTFLLLAALVAWFGCDGSRTCFWY